MQAPLDEVLDGLGEAGVELALGYERSGAVSELLVLTAEISDASFGGGLDAAELAELAAATGKPAGSSGFEGATAGRGVHVSACGLVQPFGEAVLRI